MLFELCCLFSHVCIIISIETPIVPKIDLGFALTAASTDAEETFSLMKSTVKYIVNTHGQKRLNFAFIVFGDTATTPINFRKGIPTDDELIKAIKRIRRSVGTPDIARGLEGAKNVFLQSGTRPDANKVLVLMVDRKSANSKQELESKAKDLQGEDIKIIPVLIGTEVDPKEATQLTTDKEDVIKTRKNEKPDMIGDKIIDAALLKGTQEI